MKTTNKWTSQTETCSTSEGSCSDSENELCRTSSVTADNFVGSIIEDAVGVFSDDLSDEVPVLVELLCPPVCEFEGDGCDSDEEFADVEDQSDVEEEEAKRGAASAMHPAWALIPVCTATPFQRGFVPQMARPGVPAAPFPADSLPLSPPVAKSIPPEAELDRTLPSTDLSCEAGGILMSRAEEAFQFLAAMAGEEACRLIQSRWRSGRQASVLQKHWSSHWRSTLDPSASCAQAAVERPSLFAPNRVHVTTAKTGGPRRRLSGVSSVPGAFSEAVPTQPEDRGMGSPASPAMTSRRRQGRHKVIAPEFFVQTPSESVSSVASASSKRNTRSLPSSDQAPLTEQDITKVIRPDLKDSLTESSRHLGRTYTAFGTEIFCMETVCGKVPTSPKHEGYSSRQLSSEFQCETDVTSPRQQVGREMSSPKVNCSGHGLKSIAGDGGSGAQKSATTSAKDETASWTLEGNKKKKRTKTTASAMELDLGVTAATSDVRVLAQDEGLLKSGRTKAPVAMSAVFLPPLSSTGAVLWGSTSVTDVISPMGSRRPLM
eukprot:CAMPEP_0194488330 /NCGR_PEP_ID=MMETSP0253-20130528/8287_1 /TAXON_ID=2966 /ORGANISM="Noctiluca scintillans" /LENGTH=545 /DNA_ID=CAMNT_0039328675 /DNA_START=15 /DNA_END=1652 /DNA_ORIENTATION=-